MMLKNISIILTKMLILSKYIESMYVLFCFVDWNCIKELYDVLFIAVNMFYFSRPTNSFLNSEIFYFRFVTFPLF